MNCDTVTSLLSEFADERLDAATAWLVQTHVSECAACGRISRDLVAMRRLLQTLPAQQPSTQFDAALAQKLALTRRPQKQPVWRLGLTNLFARPQFFAAPKLRPALALGLALTAGAAAMIFPLRSTTPVPAPSAIHGADPAFVADCIDQRRRDAAGEPLADFSAQNLAGHVDSAASESGSEPDADASIF